MNELNKNILLVMKYLDDPGSVSKSELEENRKVAHAYVAYVAYAADAAAAADAADAYAEKWVNKYFERSGENKQDYIDAIEAGKSREVDMPIAETVTEWIDGLPPEGAFCQVMHKSQLVECKFIGTGLGKEYIYQVSSGDLRGQIDRCIGTPKFRPLKTEAENDVDNVYDMLRAAIHEDDFNPREVASYLVHNKLLAPKGDK